MNNDDLSLDNVKDFLKEMYPGETIYEALFVSIICLNDAFKELHKQNSTLFEHLDESCASFNHIVNFVVNIQKECAIRADQKKAM